MSVNDLMVGDYVRQKISNLVLKVEVINPPYICAEGEQGQFDDIEPIELTPDVFEKNGFELNEEDTPLFTIRVYGLDKDDIALIQRPKGGWKFMHGKATSSQQELFFGEGKFVCMPIQYVHELQHALMMCGSQKKIVL